MKTLRRIKIQETGNRYRIRHEDDRHSIPELRLRGKWLKQVGFYPDQTAEIIVDDNLLIITIQRGDTR